VPDFTNYVRKPPQFKLHLKLSLQIKILLGIEQFPSGIACGDKGTGRTSGGFIKKSQFVTSY
jgi:hypothetical protein